MDIAERKFVRKPSFLTQQKVNILPYSITENWDAFWITCSLDVKPPFVTIFRREFYMNNAIDVLIHTSADERYELFLNGTRIGRGSERGDRQNWYYESYMVSLKEGSNIITAKVWSLGNFKPWAQISIQSGFILAPDNIEFNEILATGIADWECKILNNYEFIDINSMGIGTGARTILRLDEDNSKWNKPLAIEKGYSGSYYSLSHTRRILKPAVLPAMVENEVCSNKYLLAPNASREIVIELDNYYCAYPVLSINGGAGAWVTAKMSEILGGVSVGDEYILTKDGEYHCEPLWWLAGRYIIINAKSTEKPLAINIKLLQTHYPFEVESSFRSSDEFLEKLLPLGIRSLQMCKHETFMDCPFYEQLMYIGDTRIQALTGYVINSDDLQAKKALWLFGESTANFTGLPACAYPSEGFKIIPSFALWWICMLDDFVMWRGDMEFVKSVIHKARSILNSFTQKGLVKTPDGWNYYDITNEWEYGEPPVNQDNISPIFNLHLVLALERLANVECYLSEPLLSLRLKERAKDLLEEIINIFWQDDAGLFSDDVEGCYYSQHTQAIAQLIDCLPSAMRERNINALIDKNDITQVNLYFKHYLSEAYQRVGKAELVFLELKKWQSFLDKGYKTIPEGFNENTRSKCHGWGAHYIYHYFTTFAGIRPSKPEFSEVIIKPTLGELSELFVKMVHKNGFIKAEYRNGFARITLPKNLRGSFVINNNVFELNEGINEICY